MIVVGRFREIYKDDSLPSIYDFVSEKHYKDKDLVLKYLKNGKKSAVAPAKVKDVIAKEYINIELCCYTDGCYAWRSDLIYYVDKYNLKLDDGFVKHIKQRNTGDSSVSRG